MPELWPHCQSGSVDRLPPQDQDAEAQIVALEESGCELIFKEKASGGRWDRPELHRLAKAAPLRPLRSNSSSRALRRALGTRTRFRVSTLRIWLSEVIEDDIAANLQHLHQLLPEVPDGPLTTFTPSRPDFGLDLAQILL